HSASSAKRPRSVNPSRRANASKMRRTAASFSSLAVLAVLGTAAGLLPAVDQALDVTALRLGEVEPVEQPPRLPRVVVRDRSLEVLAERRRLAKLAAQPAQQAHGCLVRHSS